MSDYISSNENVQLSLPLNPAYVYSVRLTASSIATRCGFDIDEIEDIKAAVSEACAFVINELPSKVGSAFTLNFEIHKNVIEITIKAKTTVDLDLLDGDMSIIMIKALMDKFQISNVSNDCIEIKMSKNHKLVSFNSENYS